MNHYSRKHDELCIQCTHRGPFPLSGSTEEPVSHRQALRGRDEHADPDRSVLPPKHGYIADESKVVAAVMPPCEVRPVGLGGG